MQTLKVGCSRLKVVFWNSKFDSCSVDNMHVDGLIRILILKFLLEMLNEKNILVEVPDFLLCLLSEVAPQV